MRANFVVLACTKWRTLKGLEIKSDQPSSIHLNAYDSCNSQKRWKARFPFSVLASESNRHGNIGPTLKTGTLSGSLVKCYSYTTLKLFWDTISSICAFSASNMKHPSRIPEFRTRRFRLVPLRKMNAILTLRPIVDALLAPKSVEESYLNDVVINWKQ